MKPSHRSEPDAPKYRPVSVRRRLLILVLAITTAVTVVMTLLDPLGGIKRPRPVAGEPPLCSGTQQEGCLGGRAEVIVPAWSSASGASAASR